ncbi:MAG: TIGR02186 family protein [Silicimonas sp.]|nr:TIGR02186 family protein [Silicimonas sp.]MBT8425811.1 TIGR02186 family protein [Silicimonas sp.]NNL73172.1 TIGR02186 family protein [Silicimonas sp.]
MLRLALIFWLTALPALAEEVVAGLSQSRISISTNFDGSEILIFGAVKREDPIVQDPPIEVLITVEGPQRRVSVRRKEKRFGIWINTDSVEVDRAPTFYAVATSGPWTSVLKDIEDLRHKVSTLRAIRSVGATIRGSEDFTDALVRIRSNADLYQTNIGSVELTEQTLFSTSIRLPANLTEGNYKARFFLTRGGRVIDTHETLIAVQKVGLERFLFRLAHDQPFIYGLMSLAIAIAAGWGASAAFRFIRN